MSLILAKFAAIAGIAVFAWLFWGTFKEVPDGQRRHSFVAVGLCTWGFAIIVCVLALVGRF